MVLLFQVQFWFALVIVDSFVGHWTWTVYGVLLSLAIIIFLSGATVLPPPGPSKTRNLIEDFATRGKISLVFLALYLLGWIVVAIMFWTDAPRDCKFCYGDNSDHRVSRAKSEGTIYASRHANSDDDLRIGNRVDASQSGGAADVRFWGVKPTFKG
jgi:hypothetical protein